MSLKNFSFNVNEESKKAVKNKKDEFISYVKKEIERKREEENSDKKRHDVCQGKISIASQKNTLEDEVKNLKTKEIIGFLS